MPDICASAGAVTAGRSAITAHGFVPRGFHIRLSEYTRSASRQLHDVYIRQLLPAMDDFAGALLDDHRMVIDHAVAVAFG